MLRNVNPIIYNIIRTKKSAGQSVVFPLRGVWRNPTEQYNEKPTQLSMSISTIIPSVFLVAKLSEQQNKAKTLFQYVFKLCVLNYTQCFIGNT